MTILKRFTHTPAGEDGSWGFAPGFFAPPENYTLLSYGTDEAEPYWRMTFQGAGENWNINTGDPAWLAMAKEGLIWIGGEWRENIPRPADFGGVFQFDPGSGRRKAFTPGGHDYWRPFQGAAALDEAGNTQFWFWSGGWEGAPSLAGHTVDLRRCYIADSPTPAVFVEAKGHRYYVPAQVFTGPVSRAVQPSGGWKRPSVWTGERWTDEV